MEGQPLYEIGDILKPKNLIGYEVLPQALLITELEYIDTETDLYWAYGYIDLATNNTGQSSCYRVDNCYNKVA